MESYSNVLKDAEDRDQALALTQKEKEIEGGCKSVRRCVNMRQIYHNQLPLSLKEFSSSYTVYGTNKIKFVSPR